MSASLVTSSGLRSRPARQHTAVTRSGSGTGPRGSHESTGARGSVPVIVEPQSVAEEIDASPTDALLTLPVFAAGKLLLGL